MPRQSQGESLVDVGSPVVLPILTEIKEEEIIFEKKIHIPKAASQRGNATRGPATAVEKRVRRRKKLKSRRGAAESKKAQEESARNSAKSFEGPIRMTLGC